MSSCEDDGRGTSAIGETAWPHRCLAPPLDTWEGRIVRIEVLCAGGYEDEAFGGIAEGFEAAGKDMLSGQGAKRGIDLVDARQGVGR